jgi:hypothetical protein
VQSRAGRWRHFAVEKVSTTLHGMRPSAWVGRLRGPRVLANSMPKSGTHLLTRALYRCPLLHSPAGRVLRGWEAIDPRTLKRLRHLQRGQFLTGHLPAHDELLELVEQIDLRVLLMIRDPRDIMVSYGHYVAGMDTTHPAHKVFHTMNGRDRLTALIDGVPGVVSPMHEVLTRFAGWLDSRQVLILRFEDLVGAHGGGHNGLRNARLEKMLVFLGIEPTPELIRHIAKGLYSKRSLTYRKPRIGQWRTQFDDELLRMFEDSVGDLAKRFGYE